MVIEFWEWEIARLLNLEDESSRYEEWRDLKWSRLVLYIPSGVCCYLMMTGETIFFKSYF